MSIRNFEAVMPAASGLPEELKATRFYSRLLKEPLGFIDVGSLGGIHPVVEPAAPLVHALCFELDPAECRRLEEVYRREGRFAKVTVLCTALAARRNARAKLHVTAAPTNTSLLAPSLKFIRRYGAEKFREIRTVEIPTEALDRVLNRPPADDPHLGEFIKLDTQAGEYNILRGARKTLEERSLAVLCETEFFEVYRGQKTFTDISLLMREHGFLVYGLYPHYRSTRLLERTRHRTEERLMWADALFFKDPLDRLNRGRRFSDRDFDVLVLTAALTGFYDYALELLHHVLEDGAERRGIESWILSAARLDADRAAADADALSEACRREPDRTYWKIQSFASRYGSNSDVDHLVKTSSGKDVA